MGSLQFRQRQQAADGPEELTGCCDWRSERGSRTWSLSDGRCMSVWLSVSLALGLCGPLCTSAWGRDGQPDRQWNWS